MKRVLLYLATNLAILVMLSVSLFWVSRLLGINLSDGSFVGLVVIGAVLGFGGSFLSLAMSKWMAKRATGALVIESPGNAAEQWLVETVRRQARQAGIGMPEVAIYDAPDINAFATGMKRDNALVAVSTGLLAAMNRDEAEAVLGHEISHVANGDMVTLSLIQGVVNTFVFVLARVIGGIVDQALRGNSDDDSAPSHGMGYFVTTIIAEIVLGILASIIVMWFSRQREFRADAGGARLSGREKMVAALERLRAAHEPSHLPNQMAAFGINNGGGLMRLFMSHPPLEERIAALRAAR